jgi:hypothetical protein
MRQLYRHIKEMEQMRESPLAEIEVDREMIVEMRAHREEIKTLMTQACLGMAER